PRLERPFLSLRRLARLGIRDLREQTPGFGSAPERQLVEHIDQAMVPTALLLASGNTAASAPQIPRCPSPITRFGAPRPAALEIAQDRTPAFGRLAAITLDGENHRLPVAQRRQNDEDRGLIFLDPGLH